MSAAVQDAAAEALRAVALAVCGRLVARPEDVRVEAERGGTLVSVRIETNAADCRRLVGKGGATFKALSVLLRRTARHYGVAVGLDRVQAGAGAEEEFEPYRYRPDWDRPGLLRVAELVAAAALDGPVGVRLVERGQRSSLLVEHCDDGELGELSLALNTLFGVAGTVAGCFLTVDLKRYERATA